ncbi:MAG: hypothetical protein V1734_03380 [Nanoarchaeota archaeon]
MNPKGQTTIFVVLGIVILASVAIGYYMISSVNESAVDAETKIASKLPADVAEVRKAISECVQYSLEDAIARAGMFGGYTEPKTNALFTDQEFVNYAYANSRKTLPSLQDIQNNIAEYMAGTIPTCVDTENEKFKMTLPNPTATVEISDLKVFADVDYKVLLKSGDSTFTLAEPFKVESSARLKALYDAASKIADKAVESPDNINVDYLLTLGEEIDVIPFDEKNVIYRIPDKSVTLESEIGNVNLVMVFATMA